MTAMFPTAAAAAVQQQESNVAQCDARIRQKGGPEEVMKVLSQELLKLHISKRSAIEEEIHGVHCNAVEETPQLIHDALVQLHERLQHPTLIPPSHKQAYLRCQQLEIQRQKKMQRTSNNINSPTPPCCYINTEEFRLMFLRCELFDIAKTALHIVEWLEYVVTLFGEYALERPITVQDFTKEELRCFRQGNLQLLPFRDFSGGIGRKVCVVFPNEHWTSIPLRIRNKITLYTVYAAAAHDVDTQRKGLVVVAWFDANDTPTTSNTDTSTTSNSTTNTNTKASKLMLNTRLHSMGCVRFPAVHVCAPDTSFYRLRTAMFSMLMHPLYRVRFRASHGGNVELRYILSSFGIAGEAIPISWTGSIKTMYICKWLRLRHSIEQQSSTQDKQIVECPFVHDVLFKKGSPVTQHMGNIQFRNLIEAKLKHEQSLYNEHRRIQQQQQANDTTTTDPKPFSPNIRKISNAIIDTVYKLNGGRFLIWNTNHGWDILTDRTVIFSKVEFSVRFYYKQQRSTIKTKEKKKRTTARPRPRPRSTPHDHHEKDCDHPPIQMLSSGTSIFQFNTNTTTNKRQKRCLPAFVKSGNTTSDDEYGGSTTDDSCTTDLCFGMQFTPMLGNINDIADI